MTATTAPTSFTVHPSPFPLAQPTGARGTQEMGQASFLRLMTTQMQAQDPFKPMDQTQMIAQLAQFSQVAGIGEINQKLGGISDLATSLDAIAAHLSRIETALGAITAPASATASPAASTTGE